MSDSLGQPNTPESLGRMLADLDRRVRALEARPAPGGPATGIDHVGFNLSSSTYTATGPSITATPGPTGRLLILVGASVPGTVAGQFATLTWQLGLGSPVVWQAVEDFDNLILGGGFTITGSSRHSFVEGLTPGVDVQVRLVAKSNNTASIITLRNQSLTVVPL